MQKGEATTLIFPSTVSAAWEYYEHARRRGEAVVAASSLSYDETAAKFPKWFRLPTIYDPAFAEAFLALVRELDIRRVYSPVAAVHAFLQDLIRKRSLSIEQIGTPPSADVKRTYESLLDRTADAQSLIQAIGGERAALSHIEIAAVLRHADTIFGETNETKIAGVMAAFASAPKGDVVEIGALMGRSAFVLDWLAKRYDIGPVLAVDPWKTDSAIQNDSSDMMRGLTKTWDWDLVADAFVINMLPVAGLRFNFLRLESADAHRAYLAGQVTSEPFGTVEYSNRISVLHIDGNHDYRCVRKDCDLWLPHLQPGGWLVLDDYRWFHGDGPQRVGDALLKQYGTRIEVSFVCGDALFARFS